ncbi:MAG: hypothetical protein AAFV85_23365 [Cyanobacteria bacterium J06634_6]
MERHEFQSLEAWASSFEDPPVSRTVLQTFLAGEKNISRERFFAICNDLGLDWRVLAFGPEEGGAMTIAAINDSDEKAFLDDNLTTTPSVKGDDPYVQEQHVQEQPPITIQGDGNRVVTGNNNKIIETGVINGDVHFS